MYLGVDLGGTNIAAGLVDDNFNIVYKDSIPTGAQREDKEIIYDMAMLCRSILENTGTQTDDVKWIGIGLPGTPDVKEGKSIYTNNINLRNTPVRDLMQKVIPLPVYIENDANCAALGEAFAGATKEADNSLMITIGTGIGGGIIINKKIYSGFNYAGGELGHIVILLDGEQCTCGRKGAGRHTAPQALLLNKPKRPRKKPGKPYEQNDRNARQSKRKNGIRSNAGRLSGGRCGCGAIYKIFRRGNS